MTNVHVDTMLNIVNILRYYFEIEIVAQTSKYIHTYSSQ